MAVILKNILETEDYNIGFTLTLPSDSAQHTCVLIVGGSLSHDRDGQIVNNGVATNERFALKELSEQLLAGGYASLRYDRCGFGDTSCRSGRKGTNNDDEETLIALYRYLKGHKNIGKVIMAGESAGGYFSCMAARDGMQADGYIFLGALCSDSPVMLRHNYERLYRFACESEENMAWAKKYCARSLNIGANMDAIIHAAQTGEEYLTVEYGDSKFNYYMERLSQEICETPSALFKYVTTPALILQGELDMNVPPDDRKEIARILLENENKDVTCRCITDADHSFQLAPASERERIIERHNFDSFKNQYSPELYSAMIGWLNAEFETVSEK